MRTAENGNRRWTQQWITEGKKRTSFEVKWGRRAQRVFHVEGAERERAASEGLFVLNIINVRIRRLIRWGRGGRRWRIMIRPQLLQKPPQPLMSSSSSSSHSTFLSSEGNAYQHLQHLSSFCSLSFPFFISQRGPIALVQLLSPISSVSFRLCQTVCSPLFLCTEESHHTNTQSLRNNQIRTHEARQLYVTVRSVQVELVAWSVADILHVSVFE